MMDAIDKTILTHITRGLPLVARPYAELGRQIGLTEAQVIERVRVLKADGLIRRIGATLDPRQLGWYSTLCATELREDRLEQYATVVNAYAEVTHNYVRSQAPNCWFTLITPDQARARAIIAAIEAALDVQVLELPARRVFKIGVRFNLEE